MDKGKHTKSFNFRPTRVRPFLIPTVLCLIGFLVSVGLNEPASAIGSILLSFLWNTIVYYRQKDVQASKSKEAEEKVRDEKIFSSAAILDEINATASENLSRTKTTHKLLSDTAGTTVRASNMLKQLTGAGSAPGQTKTGNITADQSKQASGTKLVKNGHSEYRFPPVTPQQSDETFNGVRVCLIADEFTAQSFAYEWQIIQPTKQNWKQVLEENEFDFVFVESAWEGNAGEWRYQFTGSLAPRQEIQDLLRFAKEKEIPTVFWNKEDPPHFEDFLDTAKLFDYVFTTDENMIDSYKEKLGHERVSVLPFAAQPRIHNPARIGDVKRTRSIVFGGMYFWDKFPERRQQMDMLLPAAAEYGLDIFSRHDGSDPKYRFPENMTKHVRGSLPYLEMVTAYHAYAVVINVNSVVNSASMCARRIFEATACGAAVVSQPTLAIERFFPGSLLSTVSTREEASAIFRTLLRSPGYRDMKVHLSQREIWEKHTYTDRARTIMDTIGCSYSEPSLQRSFFVSTNRPDNLGNILENFSRQTVKNKELLILFHGVSVPTEEVTRLANDHGVENYRILESPESATLGENLNRLATEAMGDVLFRMDDDDFYAENYARDLENALKYSGADLVGKAASYIYFEDRDATILTYSAHEHRYTDFIRGATFCGWKNTFRNHKFPAQKRSEDSGFLKSLLDAGGRVYSADRFNFVVNRAKDKRQHTWTVSDEKLFATGDFQFSGNGRDQVSL
ncbi:glycosyltransferase family protein [Corynebacterium cystitidis]|uniref:glycosyltransferase family protein n=1 Tax=Corynebacterium cystitidis TaxID=35757 RepID=UPI00211EED40|nr:glycosyltransferase [Corynebacterium cystitidis]